LRRVLVDTGPLVAIFSSRDQHHEKCVAQMRAIQPPLLTCWPVLTEAAWLLRRHSDATGLLLSSIGAGFLSLLPLEQDAASQIADFLAKYKRIGAQLADAALVYLANRERIDTIFTLDRRDFSVYKTASGRSLRVIPR
jgi:predicted nucleic acid-binding protein